MRMDKVMVATYRRPGPQEHNSLCSSLLLLRRTLIQLTLHA
jgi:hypothetical protein